jgi:hypothetical protein
MDFRLDCARVVRADLKSIIISSKYGEICDFWNSDFGWFPTEMELVRVQENFIKNSIIKTLKRILEFF